MKHFLLYILLIVVLASCTSHLHLKNKRKAKKIERVKTTQYVVEEYPDSITDKLTSISISNSSYLFLNNNNIHKSKEIGYSKSDSTPTYLSISYYTNTSNFGFDLNWEKNGIEKGKDLFYFEHYSFDSINQVYFEISHTNNYRTVVMEHYSDDFEYVRTYTVPDKIVDFYIDFARINRDSIDYFELPNLPDLSSCSELLSSHHETTEYLSDDSSSIRRTKIDSTLVNGSIQVKKAIYYQSSSITTDSTGLNTELLSYQQGENQTYWERQYFNKTKPIYQLSYTLNPSTKDTLHKIEMISKRFKDSSIYQFLVTGTPPTIQNNNYEQPDYRLPIVRRNVKVWRDKKWRITKVHIIGFTDQNHRLEHSYNIDKKGKTVTLIDRRTTPEVSGVAVYDLIGPYYYTLQLNEGYTNPSKGYNKRKPSIHFFRKRRQLEFYKKGTVRVERDKKNDYEKRKFENSYEKIIFEIYYKDQK